jgi:hypothetical protein
MSADIPPPRPRPPVIKPDVPGICIAGRTPCGEPGRLFPGGWFCDQHAPGTRAEAAPERVIATVASVTAHPADRHPPTL